MAKTKKIPKVPIHGKAAHNAAFLTAIGGLVVNWSNNESVFLAMLQALLAGGKHSAAIVWYSHRTTNARLDLVYKLCREQVSNAQLLADLSKAIDTFKSLSRTRNFFCHATYDYDRNLHLMDATGVTSNQDGYPLNFVTKRMDRATLNEIGQVSLRLGELNRSLWTLVQGLQSALGVQRVNLPELLTEPRKTKDSPAHPDKD
jgi:hypothetical protein